MIPTHKIIATEKHIQRKAECSFCWKLFKVGDEIWFFRNKGITRKYCQKCSMRISTEWDRNHPKILSTCNNCSTEVKNDERNYYPDGYGRKTIFCSRKCNLEYLHKQFKIHQSQAEQIKETIKKIVGNEMTIKEQHIGVQNATSYIVPIPKTEKHTEGYHEWIVKKSWLGKSWVVEKWECYPKAFSIKEKHNHYFKTEEQAHAYAKRQREKFKQTLNANYGQVR